MASNVAENMIAAINIMFAIMNAFKSSVQQAKYNAEELSRISVNATKILTAIKRYERLTGNDTSNIYTVGELEYKE